VASVAAPARRVSKGVALSGATPALAAVYLSIIVLLPMAAVIWASTERGFGAFWRSVSSPDAVAALELTVLLSFGVVFVNAITGTLIAWVLVRDDFRGKQLVNALLDLPFALPTIVAGITLLALYGPNSPTGVNLAYTRAGVLMALLFVTLPFVVRAVQPVLIEADREMEEAAASLGARSSTVFRRIILPNLLPAILSGSALAFARAIGEFGSLVLITGMIPFKTQASSVLIFSLVESDAPEAAAAVSVALLVIALVVLLFFGWLSRKALRHEE
jgi:sulfate/thiosulfate transport system permease protein